MTTLRQLIPPAHRIRVRDVLATGTQDEAAAVLLAAGAHVVRHGSGNWFADLRDPVVAAWYQEQRQAREAAQEAERIARTRRSLEEQDRREAAWREAARADEQAARRQQAERKAAVTRQKARRRMRYPRPRS